MVAVGTLVPLAVELFQFKSTALAAAATLILLIPVGVSWAGASVFQLDGSAERLRFLADRGVSPWQVYWSRHLPMVSMLSLLACIYLVLATVVVWLGVGGPSATVLLSPLLVAVFGAVMYTTSQWFSQLVRGPVLSFLLSPIIAMTVLGWLGFCYVQTTSPFWLVVSAGVVIPMLATAILMRRFMEGRERPLSFVVAVVGVFLLVAIPLIPAMRVIGNVPTMPSQMRSRLVAEAAQLNKTRRPPVRLTDTVSRKLPDAYRELFAEHSAEDTEVINSAYLLDDPALVSEVQAS